MNLLTIRTRKDFYKLANMWRKRAFVLRDIWQDKTISSKKRDKAFDLWFIMLQRMIHISQIAIKINAPKMPKDCKIIGEAKINLKQNL